VANDLLESPLPDLRGESLTDLEAMAGGLLAAAIRRLLPDTEAAPVPVAAFQSAI
jgi:FXSXX-COOH protein